MQKKHNIVFFVDIVIAFFADLWAGGGLSSAANCATPGTGALRTSYCSGGSSASGGGATAEAAAGKAAGAAPAAPELITRVSSECHSARVYLGGRRGWRARSAAALPV